MVLAFLIKQTLFALVTLDGKERIVLFLIVQAIVTKEVSVIMVFACVMQIGQTLLATNPNAPRIA